MNRLSKWVAFLAFLVVLALIFLSTPRGKGAGKLPTGSLRPSLAIGGNHAVILASDGSLWTWGKNGSGWQVLGLGTNIRTQACLRRIGTDTNWVNIAVGGSTTLALKSDGTLWAWGREAHVFTRATNANANSSPLRVGADTDWRACAPFCQKHPAFLKRDGSLWVSEGSDQPRVTGRGGVADVTPVLAGWVTNDQLNCRAGGSELGDDPAFFMPKTLQITFQLGTVTQTLAFQENSTVSLGGTGKPLSILRELYGDASVLSNGPAASLRVVTYEPRRLRRIELPKDIVAFGTGRHGLGVALTADGQVWTWGEALGRETLPIVPLQLLSRGLNRIGMGVNWGDPHPVVLNRPTRIEVEAR
jgi:hypothetical protein